MKKNNRKNRARCKNCGDIIESKFRNDFVSCRCGLISLDGGQDYRRCIGELKYFDFNVD